jgi:hypothetical protein
VRVLRPGDVSVCVVPTRIAAACAGAISRLLGSRIQLILWVHDLMLSAARSVERDGRLAALGAPANRGDTILKPSGVDWISTANGEEWHGSTRFLYAGSIHYSQSFETLVGAAAAVPTRDRRGDWDLVMQRRVVPGRIGRRGCDVPRERPAGCRILIWSLN